MHDLEPVPPWLSGAWKRESMQRRGAPPDGTTAVRSIQTPTLFGDVRIPDARPRFPEASALCDLSDAELATLYSQQGFAGFTSVDGQISTWHHQIDYQPPDGSTDSGRIELPGGRTMLEHALDGAYVEHWWSLSSGDQAFFGVQVTRTTNGAPRMHEILAVAGDHFAYARNRPADLPVAKSLKALIASTGAGREQILAYLDCEVSHGLVRGGRVPWQIQLSTLPFKEGKRLDFVDGIAVNPSTGVVSRRGVAPEGEVWSFPVNSLKIDDLLLLFPGAVGTTPGAVGASGT